MKVDFEQVRKNIKVEKTDKTSAEARIERTAGDLFMGGHGPTVIEKRNLKTQKVMLRVLMPTGEYIVWPENLDRNGVPRHCVGWRTYKPNEIRHRRVSSEFRLNYDRADCVEIFYQD